MSKFTRLRIERARLRLAHDRLISAAPELLEALKNLSKAYIYKDDEHESNRFNAQTKAEQAIAKAEGI